MKVLVPFDDREGSQSVIDSVLSMHWPAGSQIALASILPDSDRVEGGVGVASEVQLVEDLAMELQREMPHCEVSLFLRKGDPKSEIAGIATFINANFIIIDSHYRHEFSRGYGETVAQSVLNSAPCPVIISRPKDSGSTENELGIKCVLVPIDDSVWTDAALKWMASFSWAADTRFILTAVLDAAAKEQSSMMKLNEGRYQMIDVAQQFLGLRARQLHTLGITNVFVEIGFGDTCETIIQLARRFDADLIVLGSRGKSGIKKAIMGSTSQAVSAQAPCSVAVVRGLMESDPGWNKTGVFVKPKIAPPPQAHVRQAPMRKNTDKVPHIIPGGFG